MAKLTKDQKEQKKIAKVEAVVKKAGGIYFYWLDQHKNKELGSYEKTTAAVLTVVTGKLISNCAIVKADGTRSPLKIVGNIIAGIGLISEVTTIVETTISLKQAENIKLYLKYHPDERVQFYDKVSDFLTRESADLI